MNQVLIVGAGQLGSRYLQGLIKLEEELEILVFDNSSVSIVAAKKRLTENNRLKSIHKITWLNIIPKTSMDTSLAIIATTSANRTILVNQISKLIKPRFWVLEKVLAQSESEVKQINESTNYAKAVWVNTPRRLMNLHKLLKSELKFEQPFRVTKSGTMWGLACNSIHFIDLVSWWTGEEVLSINTDKLHSKWFESKREDYYEVTGELTVNYSNGSILVLQSFLNEYESSLTIEKDSNTIWSIDENNGIAIGPKGKVLKGKLDYQSEMTAPLVSEIFKNNTSDLPTLEESSKQHIIFLNAMLAHWNMSNNRNDIKVPIT